MAPKPLAPSGISALKDLIIFHDNMPNVKEKEIQDLIKLVDEGIVGTDSKVGINQVKDLVPSINEKCAVDKKWGE